jgi:hypothetical protein
MGYSNNTPGNILERVDQIGPLWGLNDMIRLDNPYLLSFQRIMTLTPTDKKYFHKKRIFNAIINEDADVDQLYKCMIYGKFINGLGQIGEKLFGKNIYVQQIINVGMIIEGLAVTFSFNNHHYNISNLDKGTQLARLRSLEDQLSKITEMEKYKQIVHQAIDYVKRGKGDKYNPQEEKRISKADSFAHINYDIQSLLNLERGDIFSFYNLMNLTEEEKEFFDKKTILQAFIEGHIEIGYLKILKDYGKIVKAASQVIKQINQPGILSDHLEKMGTYISHMAVAQALVLHDVTISKEPLSEYLRAFVKLNNKRLLPETKKIFKAAQRKVIL